MIYITYHLILSTMKGKVGSREWMSFWNDVWCGNINLAEKFLNIAKLSASNDFKDVDCYALVNGTSIWSVI